MERVSWYALAMAPASEVRKARGRGLLRRFERAWKVDAGVGRVRCSNAAISFLVLVDTLVSQEVQLT